MYPFDTYNKSKRQITFFIFSFINSDFFALNINANNLLGINLLHSIPRCYSINGWLVVFNTFNNSSVISWQSVLLVKKSTESHRPVAIHSQTLSHNFVTSTLHYERDSNSQLYR